MPSATAAGADTVADMSVIIDPAVHARATAIRAGGR